MQHLVKLLARIARPYARTVSYLTALQSCVEQRIEPRSLFFEAGRKLIAAGEGEFEDPESCKHVRLVSSHYPIRTSSLAA